jgi:hypothetical protein
LSPRVAKIGAAAAPAQFSFVAKIRATATPAQPSFVAKIRAATAAAPAQPSFVAKIRAAAASLLQPSSASSPRFAKIRAAAAPAQPSFVAEIRAAAAPVQPSPASPIFVLLLLLLPQPSPASSPRFSKIRAAAAVLLLLRSPANSLRFVLNISLTLVPRSFGHVGVFFVQLTETDVALLPSC